MGGGPIDAPARSATAELRRVGERRDISIAGVHFTGRRRRPTGERPPLPRSLRGSGTFWLVVAAFVAAVWVSIFTIPGATGFWSSADDRILVIVDGWRSQVATDVFQGAAWLTSDPFIRVARIVLLVTLVFYRRWRHLIAAVAALALAGFIAAQMSTQIARPRPLIEPLMGWEGYSHPSLPLAALAVTVGVAGYGLFASGRSRRTWFVGAGAALAIAAFSRLYLGVDHPTDALTAVVLATALTVLIFEIFVPSQVFPVTYRRGKAAHLDIGGPRRLAIIAAMRDQLGVTVVDVHPVGLEGSAGSTPIVVRCIDHAGVEIHLFAKLYAANHMRADRWYKWGRLILYGSLEDEVRFTSVRRLVEYEDYLLRVMADAGIPGAEPHGVVEITPEREYLLVTEFLDGAAEIGDVPIDASVIDSALAVVRRLWDAGLAHRDIKPSNVMVRDGRVLLIDVAFAQIRPSPWRQAVDLANMMLVLGLRAEPEVVYGRALLQFSPDDIAEAFAATHGVTIPSQSRQLLRRTWRKEGQDLVAAFRALAPPRERIAIQRWSPRRIAVTVITIAAALALLGVIIDNLQGQGFI